MTSTFTATNTETFSISSAKYLASKVKTDLMRLNRYYFDDFGSPSHSEIAEYHDELILLQVYDFLSEVEYGFVSGEFWVKALKYTVRHSGDLSSDDDPGGIRYTKLPAGASFASLVRYNCRWQTALSSKAEFLGKTPIQRHPSNGYGGSWSGQRIYTSGGRGLSRSGIS